MPREVVPSPIPTPVKPSRSALPVAVSAAAPRSTGQPQVSYTPGSDFGAGLSFLKSNGAYQKINAVSFCSDFTEPAPADPRLIVTKTVTTAADTTCADDVNELEVAAEERGKWRGARAAEGAGLENR